MTRPALRAAGALMFLACLPALAAVPPKPAATGAGPVVVQAPPPAGAAKVRPAPKPPATMLAITAALTEMTAGLANGTYMQWLDTLPGFRFSPATAAMLVKQFGTDQLFSVRRDVKADGARDYLLTAPALRHAAPDGSTFSWEAMQGAMHLAADGRALRSEFHAPLVTIEDKDARIDVRALAGSVTSRDVDSSYGDMTGDIGSLQVLTKADGSTFAMDGLFAKFGITEQATSASMVYETGIRTLTVQDERIDDLHLAMRFDGMDKAALERFNRQSKEWKQQQNKLGKSATAAERHALMAPMMRQLALAILGNGAAVDLDDVSFAYHGNTARLHGQMHLENFTPADLDQPGALMKKVIGHGDIQVPVAMMRAWAGNLAKKQLAKTQPGADAATIDKVALAMYDNALRAAVASGYVRVEGDMLTTSIDVRDGVLLVNGKPFQMPAPGAPTAIANSPAGLMRARRIADKCTLPDFPPDVVSQDRALALSMQVMVKADGSVGKVTLARSSGNVDYDKAVLAAASHCTYIPALRNGKPVPVPDLWDIVRVPGSTHP